LIFSKEKNMIVINDDWCKGCNICIDRCPVNALEESDRLNRRGVRPPQLKENNECNYCRICELVCPDFAITVVSEEKKKDEKKTLLRSPVGGINK